MRIFPAFHFKEKIFIYLLFLKTCIFIAPSYLQKKQVKIGDKVLMF